MFHGDFHARVLPQPAVKRNQHCAGLSLLKINEFVLASNLLEAYAATGLGTMSTRGEAQLHANDGTRVPVTRTDK
jgi:hypothetical protein